MSVLVVGTLSFVDTVDAAKWKKFDSGSIYMTNSAKNPNFTKNIKPIMYYVSYYKTPNTIQMKQYYKIGNSNKKTFMYSENFIKKNNTITLILKDSKNKIISRNSAKTKLSLKNYYKLYKRLATSL